MNMAGLQEQYTWERQERWGKTARKSEPRQGGGLWSDTGIEISANEVNIYTDCVAVKKVQERKAPQVTHGKIIHQSRHNVNHNYLLLQYVLSHQGILNNEKSDRLARQANRMLPAAEGQCS